MPNRIYSIRESGITFKETAPTVSFTPKNIATATGWVSAQFDRGTVATSDRYFGRMKTKLQVAAVVGVTMTCYLVTGDGTDIDGGLSASNAALPAADRRRNLIPIGAIVADAATVGPFVAPIPLFEVVDRYIQIAWFNEMGQTLTNVAADHVVTIWAAPLELQ